MKKIFVILSSSFVLFSCSDSSTESKEATTKSADTIAVAAAPVKDPEVEKGLALVAKSDCLSCHKLTETSIGPAYAAVAEKYHGQANIIDSLAHKVIKGGSGVWGAVPMTPHPALSKEDAVAMVHYVMSIKK